jgi:hypothetical protein
MKPKFGSILCAALAILGSLPTASSLAQDNRGEAESPSTPPSTAGLVTAQEKNAGSEKIEIALLTLPEVLPPWKQLDYDVRLEFFQGGANNLCYCVRHLENLCRNFGLPIRRTDIAGLEDLGDAVLLVPDASEMLPATREALDKWIAQDKPVIVFGEVPEEWASQHGVELVKTRSNSQKHDTILFPSDGTSISGTPLQYVSYVTKYPVAQLTSSNNVEEQDAIACRQGSILFWGWSPRPHAWAVIAEQEEHRWFARLLKEFHVDVAVPVFPGERISSLKSLGVEDWGLWQGWPPYDEYFKSVMPALAGYGFDHVFFLGDYYHSMIIQKFEEELLGTPLPSPSKPQGAEDPLRDLPTMIVKAHDAGLKVHVAINPFAIRNRPLESELLKRDGLMYRYADGVLVQTAYWSPANRELKRLAVESVKEFLSHQRVDGLFIDFPRYLDSNFDYGPAMRQAFEEHVGSRFADWPGAVVNHPDVARQFAAFKRQVMNDFLGEFGLAAKKAQNDIVIEALYYWDFWPDPGGAYENIGQDPKPLVKMGALDRACGIFYTSDNAELERLIDGAIDDVGRDHFSCILSPLSFFNEHPTTMQIVDQIRILKDKGVKHALILNHVPPRLFYNRFQDGERLPQTRTPAGSDPVR